VYQFYDQGQARQAVQAQINAAQTAAEMPTAAKMAAKESHPDFNPALGYTIDSAALSVPSYDISTTLIVSAVAGGFGLVCGVMLWGLWRALQFARGVA
jgi:hypothetical protein